MKKQVLMMMVLVAGLFFATQVFAADPEVEALKKEIANQYDAILKMQLKLDQMGANSAVSAGKAKTLSFYGDFRYRHETIDLDGVDRNDRNRIRARIGMNAAVNDETTFGVRLASGADDPVSTNQTLDGAFTSKNIYLDLAFLSWKPAAMPGFNALAGKMENPFYNVSKNQLIWDGDVTPEGIAAKYETELMENLKMFGNAGGMWVDQRGAGGDHAGLWGLQGGLNYAADKMYMLGGATYYDYSHVINNGALYGGNFSGNSNEGGVFTNDYNLVELFGEVGTEALGLPLAVYGNYVWNLDADNEENGWMTGVTLNKLKDPGSWELGYGFRSLEDDAVLGTLSDSDFIGGGTNGFGHVVSAGYQLAKNVSTALTAQLSTKDSDADGDPATGKENGSQYQRYQFDVMLKF